MKKFLVLFFTGLFLTINYSYSADYRIDELNLRPTKMVYLPKGTFIKLTNLKEFSSQFVDEGEEIIMVSTADIFMGDTKLIPQKSKFYGYIEKIREPVQGTNAAIIIKMTKFVTPEGIPYEISGHIASLNGDLFLGGARTPALYYVRMPHYSRWRLTRWKVGAAQYCETNTRQFGVHTTVKAGAEVLLVIEEDFDLVQ